MEDVRTRRGADIDSDHHLVVAKMKMKLKKHWTAEETAIQKFNTAFLRDTNKFNEFKITLNNKFLSVKYLPKKRKLLWRTTGKVLGRKKYRRKEWVSIEILDKIQERKDKKTANNNSRTRTEKVKAQAEYTEANREKEGYIIEMPKKGNLSKYENYRGITLLSAPGKVFNRVLLNRMKDSVDAQLRDQQAGFRKDRSCTDQIATLRIIFEQLFEWNSSLYINFIDYEKSFDSVNRKTSKELLRHYGVPEIFNIIPNSYDGFQCKVVHGGRLTDSFQVRTGVRQGCLHSLFHFWWLTGS
ncbi:unnamed protein product [Schistosoma mattheei]|uniref:Reverse transcriptase domain-containing protein n=1 Tax=Schistosoma mattheei TaxID=31246 RepID=A0A183PP06_9TREM|nr:unnamed protein product [Schistosoma mattheei]